MNVLGIETSCDETAAAIVRSGSEILSNVVFSQIPMHKPYGGVVPEIAARNHVEQLPCMIQRAISESGAAWEDLDRIAVTSGPGLAGSLLAGVSAAKALSQRLAVPLVGIHHLHAHIYSAFIGEGPEGFEAFCPFIALLVSGGHTCLVRVEGLGRYSVLGKTLDDAAGEALDKAANLLGLGYPGGPAIDRIGASGDPDKISFPISDIDRKYCPGGLNAGMCFSFSGVKTSLLYYLKEHPLSGNEVKMADIAAGFQKAVVSALINKTQTALAQTGIRNVIAAGGVSLNRSLRAGLEQMAESKGYYLKLASEALCGDNAVMVAGLAGAGEGWIPDDPALLDICPDPEF